MEVLEVAIEVNFYLKVRYNCIYIHSNLYKGNQLADREKKRF